MGLDEEASGGSELSGLECQTLNTNGTSSGSPATHAPGLPAVIPTAGRCLGGERHMVAVPMGPCGILSNRHRQQADSRAELQSQSAISHLENTGYVLLLMFCLNGVSAPWG